MTNEQLIKTLRTARLAFQDGDNKTEFAKLVEISRQRFDALENPVELDSVSFKYIKKYAEIVGLEFILIKKKIETPTNETQTEAQGNIYSGDALRLLNGDTVNLENNG